MATVEEPPPTPFWLISDPVLNRKGLAQGDSSQAISALESEEKINAARAPLMEKAPQSAARALGSR